MKYFIYSTGISMLYKMLQVSSLPIKYYVSPGTYLFFKFYLIFHLCNGVTSEVF